MGRTKQKVAIWLAAALAAAGLSAWLQGQDARFGRFTTGGYLNGIGWLAMDSEQRSSFRIGFHDGVRAGISFASRRRSSNEDPEALADEILVHDHPGLDVEDQIDGIYKNDANLRIPIALVYQVVKLELTPEGVRLALERLRKDIKQ